MTGTVIPFPTAAAHRGSLSHGFVVELDDAFEANAQRALTGMAARYGEDGIGHGFEVMHRWLRKRRARMAAAVASVGEHRP